MRDKQTTRPILAVIAASRSDIGRLMYFSADKAIGSLESYIGGEGRWFSLQGVLEGPWKDLLVSGKITEAKLIPVSYLVNEQRKQILATAITDVGHLGIDGIRHVRKAVINEFQADKLRIKPIMLGMLFNHGFAEADSSEIATALCSKHAVSLLHAIDKTSIQERIREVAHSLKLKEAWADVEVPLSSWVEPLTSYVFGAEEAKMLKTVRKEKESERVRERAAAREDEAAARSWAFVDRYSSDRRGIRLQHVSRRCLECGDNRIISKRAAFGLPNRTCQNCGVEWYASHCWSCGSGKIDSRDPDTPACPVCKWHKCAQCQACNQSGCSTNPYNSGNRARDNR
jgi:hypothetical protein